MNWTLLGFGALPFPVCLKCTKLKMWVFNWWEEWCQNLTLEHVKITMGTTTTKNEICDSHSRGFLVVKNLPANPGDVKDVDSIPGSGRSSEGEHGNLLQYSCLENPMDRGAWHATIHGITKSFSGLSDCHYYHHSKQFYYNFWSMVKLRI